MWLFVCVHLVRDKDGVPAAFSSAAAAAAAAAAV
jgi:hypothetical protein